MIGKPRIYIHCGLFGDKYKPIMDEFVEFIDNSNMSTDVDVIVCTVGSDECTEKWYNKENNHPDITKGEFHTLGMLKKWADSTTTRIPVGYVQTKGVFNGFDNPCIIDWRRYMAYFTLEKMKDCIDAMNSGYDAAGVDWKEEPNKHFSGTFWWSNTDYIKSLPQIDPPNFFINGCPSYRHLAEFWIGYNNPKVKCFHQSNINIYERHLHRYLPEKYR